LKNIFLQIANLYHRLQSLFRTSRPAIEAREEGETPEERVTETPEAVMIVEAPEAPEASPEPVRPRHDVHVSRWNGNEQDRFVDITRKILLDVVGKNIYIDVPHGELASCFSREDFHIVFWSQQRMMRERSHPPEEIWGVNVNCRDSAFHPSGNGYVFEDCRTGYGVAELVGNVLYIHHDLCHTGRESELRIYEMLLTKVAEYLQQGLSKEAIAQQMRERQLREQERTVQLFIDMARKDRDANLQSLQDQMKEARRDVRKSTLVLIKNVQESDRLTRVQRAMSTAVADVRKAILEQLSVLEENERIVAMTVYVATICLQTIPLAVARGGEEKSWVIYVNTGGNDQGVRWYCCTKDTQGRPERLIPYELKDSSHLVAFAELIGERNFVDLADMAIEAIRGDLLTLVDKNDISE